MKEKHYAVHIVDATIESDVKRWNKFSKVKDPDKVLKYGGMSNGIAQIVTDVCRVCNHGEIGSLFFHGHGGPGGMIVTGGKDKKTAINERSALFHKVIGIPEVSDDLRKLKPYFSKNGLIVLRGCNTGQGDKGRALAKIMSKVTNVNVLASKWYQIVGRPYLLGDIIKANPDGEVTDVSVLGEQGMDRLFKESFEEWALIHLAEWFWDADD